LLSETNSLTNINRCEQSDLSIPQGYQGILGVERGLADDFAARQIGEERRAADAMDPCRPIHCRQEPASMVMLAFMD